MVIRYLLAFIVVFSGLLTALEYSSSDNIEMSSADMTSEDVEDLELIPLVEMENPIALVTPAAEQEAVEMEVVDDVEVTDTARLPEAALEILNEKTPPLAELPTTTEGVGEGQSSSLTQLSTEDPVPLRVVQQLPEFPGGQSAFIEWLTQRLRHPSNMKNVYTKHPVLASFIIEEDGSVSNISIVESVSPSFDNEVLRVLKLMPKWKPGKMHAKTCRTLVHLPVHFRL